jgi:hypothetical protein
MSTKNGFFKIQLPLKGLKEVKEGKKGKKGKRYFLVGFLKLIRSGLFKS